MTITSRPATLRSAESARDEHVVAPGLWPHLPNLGLAALRVVTGLMFMQHGIQKHFGLLLSPGQPPFGHIAPFSAVWIAGALELVGGALIALGLLTRPVAFLLSGEMAVAYFTVHAKLGLFPIVNRGELAVLYCFVFLMFFGVGGGRFSLDQLFRHRHASRAEPLEAEEHSAV
jgi:putative oxidoreductase